MNLIQEGKGRQIISRRHGYRTFKYLALARLCRPKRPQLGECVSGRCVQCRPAI